MIIVMKAFEKIEMINWLNGWLNIPKELENISFGFEGKGFKPQSDLLLLHQVHGKKIVSANSIQTAPQTDGDGIFTNYPADVLGVKSADCLPVLLIDGNHSFAMALHCGWRSLVAGILKEGIEIFTHNGISASNITALLGPAISSSEFEVGPEVVDAFQESSFGLNDVEIGYLLSKGKNDRWHIDLGLAACMSLINLGADPKKLYVDRTCTVKQKDFNSYRREKDKRGNNYSWIKL